MALLSLHEFVPNSLFCAMICLVEDEAGKWVYPRNI